MGQHRQKVLGVPAVLLVTGVVTDLIYYRTTATARGDADLLDLAGWEAGLWFVCTMLNVVCLMLAWVYAFDIIGQVMRGAVGQFGRVGDKGAAARGAQVKGRWRQAYSMPNCDRPGS